MKAAICEKYGSPEVLKIKEIEKPTPKSNELLIKVMATAVNSADVRIRSLGVEGFMRIIMRLVLGFRGPRKKILGTVLSGVVEAVGDKVTQFKPGDEVYAMTGMKLGGCAEYATLGENGPVTLKPEKASFEQAAALPFGGTTALYFLEKAGIQQSGKKVLVYGASGAVGTAAVQIAKYYGADVTAVCSGANVELVKSLGADRVIDYTLDDFTKGSDRYDIVFDAVAKQPKGASNVLARGGTYITTGGLSVASENKQQLLLLAELFDKGQYKAVIDKTYPLKEIVAAHQYVDQGKKKGNVIITVAA